MKHTVLKIIPCFLIALFVVNCSFHPMVPPGEIISIETPGTLHKGKISVSTATGMVIPWIFGPVVSNAWAKLKYGATDNLDLSVSVSVVDIGDTQETVQGLKKYSLGAYVAAKIALLPKYIALNGGMGIGYSDVGNYYNFDGGIIIGWENQYVVPFGQGDLFLGEPSNPQYHDLSHINRNQNASLFSTPNLYKPSETWGIKLNAGAKLPVSQWLEKSNRFSVACAAGVAYAQDREYSRLFILFGAGAEYTF